MVATLRLLVSSAMWEQKLCVMASVEMFLRSLEFMWVFYSSVLFCACEKRQERAPNVVMVLWGGHGSILSSTCQGASALSIAIFLSCLPAAVGSPSPHVHHNSANLTHRKWLKVLIFPELPILQKVFRVKSIRGFPLILVKQQRA